jgi:Bacterial Ig-like domain
MHVCGTPRRSTPFGVSGLLLVLASAALAGCLEPGYTSKRAQSKGNCIAKGGTWESSGEDAGCTIGPKAPKVLALVSTSSHPAGVDPSPTVLVGDVFAGAVVELFADASCSDEALVATGVADGRSIQLVASPLAVEGYTEFRAQVTDARGITSPCSKALAAYDYDLTPPVVTGLPSGAASAAATRSIVLEWGCAQERFGCTYSYVVDASPVTIPATPFVSTSRFVQESGDGIYYLHLIARDGAGNLSPIIHHRFVLDNSAPPAALTFELASPTASPGNLRTPIIRVSGVATGDTVSLFADPSCGTGSLRGAAEVLGSSVGVTVSPLLSDAEYRFYGKVTDVAGNVSPCSTGSLAYVLDTNPPKLSGIFNDSIPKQSKVWTLRCTEEPCTYSYLIDQSPTTQPTAAFAAATTASQVGGTGTYYLHVKARDAAGNTSQTLHVSAVLSSTAPAMPTELSLVSPASPVSTNRTPVIRVSGVRSGDRISLHASSDCSAASQKVVTTASGNFVDLVVPSIQSDAVIEYHARATDSAGNQSDCSAALLSYELDTTAPAVTGLVDSVTPKKSHSWSWSCNDLPCTYSVVVDQLASTSPTGTYAAAASASQPSGDGTYRVHVIARDAAGNTSVVAHASALIDNTPPAPPSSVTLVDPASSPGSDPTPKISIGGVAAGELVSVYTDSECQASSLKASGTVLASASSIDLTASDLGADGAKVLYSQSVDVAGNISSCSSALASYTLDTTAPSVTGLANDSTPALSKTWSWGCSESPCTYAYVIDQLATTDPSSGASSAFGSAVTATQSSGDGTYYLHVVARDAAGNTSVPVHVSAVLDNTAPERPLQPPATSQRLCSGLEASSQEIRSASMPPPTARSFRSRQVALQPEAPSISHRMHWARTEIIRSTPRRSIRLAIFLRARWCTQPTASTPLRRP